MEFPRCLGSVPAEALLVDFGMGGDLEAWAACLILASASCGCARPVKWADPAFYLKRQLESWLIAQPSWGLLWPWRFSTPPRRFGCVLARSGCAWWGAC